MGLKKLAAKVAEYNDRLAHGKTAKINPDHVEKVLNKLRAKEAQLGRELGETTDPAKKTRIERKRGIARQHVERAEWLLREIG